MIAWTEVESSVIAAEAYDEAEEAIYVRFKNGQVWVYPGCPPHVWAEFTAPGQSRGSYLNRVLKQKPGARKAE